MDDASPRLDPAVERPTDATGEEASMPALSSPRIRDKDLADAASEARAARWLAENAKAIAAWNAYVETNGLPLADLRLF